MYQALPCRGEQPMVDIESSPDSRDQRGLDTAQSVFEVVPVRRHHLRRSGRRRRAPVGDEVRDGHVGLVADGGNHWNPGGRDPPRHGLQVEGRKVLQRPAAPGE